MRTPESMRIIGLMSGTSLDGLDLALVHFTASEQGWNYQIEAAKGVSYNSEMRLELEKSISLKGDKLLALHAKYGNWLGDQVQHFLTEIDNTPHAVASHGHTIHHRPDLGFTFQLGCPQRIAIKCGLPVVGDFRSLDVALGGQGAPLVPIGDRILFGQFDFCLNLGGISNISFEQNHNRIAFDIGIANMLLNYLSRQAGMEYDAGGALAQKGTVNTELLQALDALPYYRQNFPKSTGYEWFMESVVPILNRYPDSVENLLRTASEHIAGQIVNQIFRLSSKDNPSVLVTGGGTLNTFLVQLFEEKGNCQIHWVIPDKELIDYKEALIFALLGALRLRGKTNVLRSVTGATRDSCSGVVYLP